ncbi:MAG: glycosyltransferase family 4 protein [Chloroflexi bacterium]|nr:glycosyltransferase family 4 protein [Chloroflexota bacterium]
MLTPFASPNRGGAETHIDRLIVALARRNILVTLLTYQPLVSPVKAAAREPLPNGEVIRIPWFGRGWHPRIEPYAPLNFAYLVPGLLAGAIRYRIMEKTDFDVIHAHGFAAAVVALGLRWTGLRQPITVSTHAVYGLTGRSPLARAVRMLLGRVDQTLAVSEASRRELVGIGLDPVGVGVYRHWVDVDVFRPARSRAEARASLGWEPSAPTCLFVGRLLRKKGVEVVLELARRMPDVSFRILGAEGDMDYEVVDAAASIANLDLMRDPGGPENDRLKTIAGMYAAADLLLVPSQYDEAAGLVVLESSAAGTPVVASDLGGLRETVTPENGRLVEPTVDAFETAVRGMLSERESLSPLRTSARAFAVRQFSERNVDLIVQRYGLDFDNAAN